MIRFFVKILVNISAQTHSKGMALSLVLGCFIGLMPSHIFLLLFGTLVTLFLGSWFGFLASFIVFNLVDGVMVYPFHYIGDFFLSVNSLASFYRLIESVSLLGVFSWNNTIFFGAYVVTLMLFVPLKRLVELGLIALNWDQFIEKN